MVSAVVESYIAGKKAKAAPAAQAVFHRLEELYTKKHWHQLTEELKTCLRNPDFTASLNLMEFHEKFMADFEHRLNVLSLVQILLPIVHSVEPKAGVAFIESFKARLSKETGGGTGKTEAEKEALVLTNSTLVNLSLRLKDPKGKVLDINNIRTLVEETEKLVDDLQGVTMVNGEFHKAHAAYLCEIANHAGYYREALRYLGCVDLEKDLSPEERLLTAQRLCASALLGKDVFNFGELLAHPILAVFKGRPDEWLVELVKAFNAGDIKRFNALQPKWGHSVDFVRHKDDLLSKIQLLAVMETAFARPTRERQVGFVELAAKTGVEVGEVELLAMKALSRHLVRGSIDQVAQTVTFTWVQPRVLDPPMVKEMQKRIEDWSKDVSETSKFIETNASEIIVR